MSSDMFPVTRHWDDVHDINEFSRWFHGQKFNSVTKLLEFAAIETNMLSEGTNSTSIFDGVEQKPLWVLGRSKCVNSPGLRILSRCSEIITSAFWEFFTKSSMHVRPHHSCFPAGAHLPPTGSSSGRQKKKKRSSELRKLYLLTKCVVFNAVYFSN